MRLLSGCAAVIPATCAVALWFLTVGLAFTPSPAAFVTGAAAIAFSWATLWLFRWKPNAPVPWNAPVRDAMAALPPGTRVRRSRAGRSPLTLYLAWAIYLIGLAFAVLAAAGAQEDAQLIVPGIVLCATGGTAGALLGLGHDARGRRTSIALAFGFALAPALLVVVGSWGQAAAESRLIELVLSGLGIAAIIGLPVMAGFLVARGVYAFYRSTRPVVVDTGLVPAELVEELERATDHGRADAILRRYNLESDGLTLFAEDREALSRAGYELACESHSREADRSASIRGHLILRSDQEQFVLEALFVRPQLLPWLSGAQAAHP